MNDRDPGLSVMFEQLMPPPPGEPAWGDVLARAETHQNAPRRWLGGRRLGAYAAAVILVAVALSIGLLGPWTGAPDIVARASAALQIRPDTILYEKITFQTNGPNHIVRELWLGSDGRFRSVALRDGQVIMDDGRLGVGKPYLIYDASTNTLRAVCGTDTPQAEDPVAIIRSDLAAGKLRADGTATIAGRTVDRLITRGGTAILYVDPHTYAPVEVRSTFTARSTIGPVKNGVEPKYGKEHHIIEVEKILAYTNLPATAANSKLTSIVAQHPTSTLTGISRFNANC